MRAFLNLTRALGDQTRVRILLALRGGELCVCQITALLGLAPSTVSKHLSLLHQAGLVASRKTERWVYYRLPGRSAPVPVRTALAWVAKSIARDERILSDARQLKTILQTNPAELCPRSSPK